jgi:cellulose synthase/poly-beta-1,6-N-acetylglucosamine synthase-like glycosyltransferase
MSVVALIASWALGILLVPLSIVVLVFATQVGAAVRRGASVGVVRTPSRSERSRLAVLVPAHNEAAGIARTIETVLPQLRNGDRVVVVADNCDDETARVAREAGALVVERSHDTERGKGYALAFGVDSLRADPPGVVVILDADCDLAPKALDALVDCVVTTGRPAQALYLMLAPAQASLPRRVAQFAWRVRNWVRPAGWHRLGLPCQLMGTGMAFTWPMLREAPLANGSIVEDMKLGVDLALGGRAPCFCEQALVTSQFPETGAATRTQRTRWEHGHLEMILREGLPMALAAVRRRDASLLGMALDLCVPPLALLAGLLMLSLMVAAVGCFAGAGSAGIALASIPLCIFVGAAVLAWTARGRDLVRPAEMLSVPWYIFAKIPLYLRFVFKRQKKWVRTDRDLP